MQVIAFKGFGQTVYPDYVDGEVYVKINGVGNQIPTYNIRQLTAMDILNKIDKHLNKLADTTIMKDSIAYQYALLQATTLNTNLVSAEQHVLDEKWVNALYIRLRFTGNDSISTQEAQDVDALALQCPYIGGEAVYKARMLNTVYFPTKQYNDLLLCNNAGVYKNGKGLFDDEDAMLDSMMNIRTEKISIFKNEGISIYPNPANTYINIEYKIKSNEKARVLIYDMWGREVENIILDENTNHKLISLSNYISGFYTYKYSVNELISYTGKFVVLKN